MPAHDNFTAPCSTQTKNRLEWVPATLNAVLARETATLFVIHATDKKDGMTSAAELAHVVSEPIFNVARLVQATLQQGRFIFSSCMSVPKRIAIGHRQGVSARDSATRESCAHPESRFTAENAAGAG